VLFRKRMISGWPKETTPRARGLRAFLCDKMNFPGQLPRPGGTRRCPRAADPVSSVGPMPARRAKIAIAI